MYGIKRRNTSYSGAGNRESIYDLTIPEMWNSRIVIFLHGYMGYKDWGCWSLVEHYFTNEGYGFVKYNVSHNGGTVDNPIDFDDLDAFSMNNYSKEIDDFESICRLIIDEFSQSEIYLIGHSRGGGIALLQSQHDRVKKIATLAAISSIGHRFPTGNNLLEWKKNKISYRKNGRTKQEMPSHISQYEDYLMNKDRLDIEKYCRKSKIPTCVVHGTADLAVKIGEGVAISEWLNVKLFEMEDVAHTFGSSQPWLEKELPLVLETACNHILTFFEFENK